MQAGHLIFSFTLFALASSLSLRQNFPEHSNGSLPDAVQNSHCRCNHGKCVTDKVGNVKCVCKPGYALQDDFTCKPCDCGKKGKCIFTLMPKSRRDYTYKKKCICDLGSAEKDGKCVDCYCGENSACEFHGEEKNCYCIDGYSEKDGVCTKCDCGFFGTCDFIKGIKTCHCDEGYLELNGFCKVDPCESQPCQNGATCVSDGENYKCVCTQRYGGRNCDDKICTPSEVKNCGTARCAFEESSGEAVCVCPEGELFDIHSLTCYEDVCKKYTPCENGGTCQMSGISSYQCLCPERFGGYKCESKICTTKEKADCGTAKCAFQEASAGAVCVCPEEELFDLFSKTCYEDVCKKYTPCENGGTCQRSGISSYQCLCPERFGGHKCESKICLTKEKADCWPVDCEFRESSERPQCVCPEKQQFNTLTKKCEECDCGLYGECRFINGEKICICTNGYVPKGNKCIERCGPFRPCRNAGTCVKGYCNCRPEASGDYCEVLDRCYNFCPSLEGIICVDGQRGPYCECHDLNLRYDPERKQCHVPCVKGAYSCKNSGLCSGSENASFCRCPEGTTGDLCEQVPGCKNMICGSEADCSYDTRSQKAVCACRDLSLSFDLQDKRCKKTCKADSDCKNGGKCFGEFCGCLVGTSGDLCEVVLECKMLDCRPDAICTYSVHKKSAVCSCVKERYAYDEKDRTCKRTCSGDSTCHNGGLCKQRGDHPFCECKVGTSGHLCETVDECQKGLCGYSGSVDCVYDVAKEGAVCKCRNLQHLYDPASKTCKGCNCGKNSISCTLEGGKKICDCRNGYEASNGMCQKVRCTDKRCDNGKCQIVDSVEVCSCYEGYELDGDYCRKLNCSKTPCVNGTCIVRHGNKEECVCQAGYTLKDGVCMRGACRMDTCFGGICDTVDGELMCICPKNYSLQGIGCYATVCRKQHCFGGSCLVNEKYEEICTCREGYYLENDVCKKILCTLPCFGGQCKIIDGKEECICLPGYSIFRGVCRENGVLQ